MICILLFQLLSELCSPFVYIQRQFSQELRITYESKLSTFHLVSILHTPQGSHELLVGGIVSHTAYSFLTDKPGFLTY